MNNPILDAILRFVTAIREAIHPDIIKCSCALGSECVTCEFHLACEDLTEQLREIEKTQNPPIAGMALLMPPTPPSMSIRDVAAGIKQRRASLAPQAAATVEVSQPPPPLIPIALSVSFVCSKCQFEIDVFRQRPKSPLQIQCPNCEASCGIFLTIVEPPSSEARMVGQPVRRTFTCPKCGGHAFTSSNCTDPGSMVRHCTGFLEPYKKGRRPCDFSWPCADDAKYYS